MNDGDLMEATIDVHPFGKDGAAMLSMTLEETGHLARQLWQVVTDARNDLPPERSLSLVVTR
jgi:hypothetical protein